MLTSDRFSELALLLPYHDIDLVFFGGAVKALVDAAATMKAKRSMYAETHRERLAILEAVRVCEWNVETDPVAVFVKDGLVIEHDFQHGYVCYP